MSQSLYRKYRPQIFASVEGQEHIVQTLRGALTAGRIGQAYLFCGPRGTGKTTLARLLAKAVNCQQRKDGEYEPCDRCPVCLAVNQGNSLDLIEIDAASQTGVDNIRELTESVRLAAPGGGYKVFLIDETHMLSKSAFNALLKTLEEPPAHAIFILATTEPHKLPETILSRVQRLDFKKISESQVVTKLKKIAQAERLEIEAGAMGILASWSGGSLRDAESALAKLMSYASPAQNSSAKEKMVITAQQAAELLGVVPATIHDNLLTKLFARDMVGALALVSDLYEQGMDLENFTKQFVGYTRAKLVASVGQPAVSNTMNDPSHLVRVINAFIKAKTEFRNSPVPQLPLELAVLELTNGGKS